MPMTAEKWLLLLVALWALPQLQGCTKTYAANGVFTQSGQVSWGGDSLVGTPVPAPIESPSAAVEIPAPRPAPVFATELPVEPAVDIEVPQLPAPASAAPEAAVPQTSPAESGSGTVGTSSGGTGGRAPSVVEAAGGASSPPGAAKEAAPFDDYLATALGADPHLSLPGPPGELRVWIGRAVQKPDLPSEMVQSEVVTIKKAGKSALVTPFPKFIRFDPPESKCALLDPSGVTVRFNFYPRETGKLRVGADVSIFSSDDCTGTPVPKPAANLEVTVEVADWRTIIKYYSSQLWEATWKATLDFWGGLVASVLALVAIFFRRKIAGLLRINLGEDNSK